MGGVEVHAGPGGAIRLAVCACVALLACLVLAPAVAVARPEAVSGLGTFDEGFEPSISATGRFVAFAGAPESVFQTGPQIYVRDRGMRQTTLASVAAAGGQPDGESRSPSISSSGRYVAFASAATDLVSGDTNANTDIFLRDRDAGTTVRVSVSSAGAAANGASQTPSLSADGRVVAFVSSATNLAGTDTHDFTDVFVRDLVAGTTVRASNGLLGAESNGDSFPVAISGDGTTVVFASSASNLVDGDTNGAVDVFAYDRATALVRRVNTTATGAQANGGTVNFLGGPATNGNGSVFAFATYAQNLLGGPPSGPDLVARDTTANTVERLTRGAELDNLYDEAGSAGPSMSGDGRRVAFATAGQQLPASLDRGSMNVYVRDRQTGRLTHVGGVSQCIADEGISGEPSISADGRWVAFQSNSINLLAPRTYEGGTPFAHVYVASALPPRGAAVCRFSVRPRTITSGGRFTFVLGNRGSVRIAIFRRIVGRLFGRSCREPNVRFPGRRRCTRLVLQGTLRRSGLAAGADSIAFDGRIGRHTLAPGLYRAVAKGNAPGSRSRRVSFTIRRR